MASKKKQSNSPEKKNDTMRPWEQTGAQTAWEKQPVERHPHEEIQQLEQVAKRLVAKVKEIVEPAEKTNRLELVGRQGELEAEQQKDVEWITDLVIDAITVIENKEERNKKMKKWSEEYVLR